MGGEAELPIIVYADGALRAVFGAGERGQQQAREDGDNGDDDE
jgi:hypothetical protein